MQLDWNDPKYMELALYLERRYRSGPHFRGAEYHSVTAKHKETGEVQKFECNGASKAEIRAEVRRLLDDSKRPYKWELSVTQAVQGLGGRSTWSDLVQLQG